MALAYQTFSDPQAAARFLIERPEARLLGGGTILVRRVNEGDISIGTYVRVLAPELKQIDIANDIVRLGAGVTMSELPSPQRLRSSLPSLSQSAARRSRGGDGRGQSFRAESPWRLRCSAACAGCRCFH